ncbi:Alpha-acetolactate decarboxylase [Methanoculleus thermophilus]|jgi:acetolactate decarboxylase|uniref:Alpha-acetolactate decarboxylase n=1 Tax=Methanoculleus thermophilus TaxID=2200 RepID=A0A1G8Y0D1_9EURY|nr:Alpha-acetolactate decarboxylase [Methanoculleus thermophilus]
MRISGYYERFYMNKRTLFYYGAAALAISFFAGVCITLMIAPIFAGPDDEIDRERLFQVSTIDALLQGVYDGSMTYDELATYGDLGIGCAIGSTGNSLGWTASGI